ncbi:MAG: hypothetical protein Q7S27_02120 [Nanoarchaeota archaeon]|nr:hypothetical protein [Nanoarchaeota archaeon]
MRKEEIDLMSQFLSGMRDAVFRLEEAERRKDKLKLDSAKKEILQFQLQIKRLL